MILPLALAQFIASYAATNMNVAISAIAKDLSTTVAGVQTAITLFTLTMAALMIPGIYILITVVFPDVKSRARYFGVVSGAGGLGAAAGPLIGGLVTSAISWRASFGLQVLVVAWIILLARKITEPAVSGRRPRFDVTGAVLSAAGLFFLVLGLLQSRTYGFFVSRTDFKIGSTVVIPKGSISPVWLYVAIGAVFLAWFFLHVRSGERKKRDVLLPLRLFRNKTPPSGPRDPGDPVADHAGILLHDLGLSSGGQPLRRGQDRAGADPGHHRHPGRLRQCRQVRQAHPQRWLIIAGFLVTVVGMALLLALVRAHSGIATWIPGLLLFGIGVGVRAVAEIASHSAFQ
jgi:MFS family permease